MAAEGYLSKDVVPLVAMITVEFTNVGLNTIFKAATLAGMSYYVFIVYSYAVASLILLPFAFMASRKNNTRNQLPPFTLSLLCKIIGLGMIGVTAQVLAFAGINLGTPTLASAIGNLTPAFTFIFAIIFRLENVSARSSVSQAKLLGTFVSIIGAFVVVFYKGPAIVTTASSQVVPQVLTPANSLHSQWILGGTLLATEYLLLAIWYIVQTKIIKLYPSEPIVVLLYTICAMFISIPVCLYGEPDLHAWKLSPNLGLAAILYSGFFGSGFSTVVHTWGLRIKGPVYISIFRPLSIIIAAAMGFVFLGDNLYLGCVIGAVIISVGFYAVMWGKARELRDDETKTAIESGLPKYTTPLLKAEIH